MNIENAKQISETVFSAACRLTRNPSRREAAQALLDAANAIGVTGPEKRFALDRGMSMFGYGGGWSL